MLPIWKSIEIRTQLPKPKDYPFEVTNLGDAIKKKRMDLKLSKVELGQVLNVTPESIGFYERNEKKPLLHILKRILDWLGYIPPLGADRNTIGGQLYIYRIQKGLTQKEVARRLRIDNTVIWKIENNQYINPKCLEKFKALYSKILFIH